MLRGKAAPAETALRQRLDDDSVAVQVAAAEALARMGRADAALPVLERCLKNSQSPWFALQAENVLDRLGESARPVLPALREMLQRVAGEEGGKSAFQYQRRILDRIIAVLDGKELPLVYPVFN